jgi:transposase
LWSEFNDHQARVQRATRKIKAFIAKASKREKEIRTIIKTAPGVGFVTAEVVISELADVSRFPNAKKICAYAGLVPAVRQTGGKQSKDLPITKQGSGLLRWALVESAWRLVKTSPKWSAFFSRLKQRSGSKRAIVAVARKLLCMLYAMLKTSTPYKVMPTQAKTPKITIKRLKSVSTPAT